MLNWIVSTCLRHRLVVVVVAGVLVVAGVVVALRSPLDVFPEFAPPTVEVQTEAPGLSSEAVERLVTVPLEGALNGLPRMTTLRSRSVQGMSQVQMLFQPGTDLVGARQMVSERVAGVAGRLPQQARAPHVMPPLSSTSMVLKIGLTPKHAADLAPGEPRLTQTDLSVLMEWTIEPRLLAVPGVANISTFGLHDRQYQVQVRPEQLRAHGVTLEQVKQATGQAAVYGSAGFHDSPNQRLAVQVTTRVTSPQDLAQTVVAFQGDAATQRHGDPATPGTESVAASARPPLAASPVLLGQVATLTEGNAPFIGEGVINDEPGLLVVVEKYPWANTLEVTRDTEAALETLRPALAGVRVNTAIFRPASFIEQALGNLQVAMTLGCVLVALILGAFLFEWRTAIISLAAIPLSLVAAVVVLSLLGGTLNTMVLAGLAIAIGEVVDDAIIDVENIVRRLRLNREDANPRPAFRVVLDASLEVRSAVVYASFIVVFVCLPILLLGGVAGSFFRPLALAYILAVLASLVVALTVTPALALLLLPQAVQRQRDGPLVRAVRGLYRRVLPVALHHPVLVLGLAALALLAAVPAFLLLREEFLPQFQERDFVVHRTAKPGTGIDVLRQDAQALSRELRAETAVRAFGAQIARAETGEDVVGTNSAELWVSLDPAAEDYAAQREQIEAVLARHAGFDYDVLSYLQERIQEVLSGAGAAVVLRTYGPDLATLRQQAQRIRAAIEGEAGGGPVPGVIDLRVEPQVLVPQLELVLDPQRVAAHGLTPGAITDAVTTLVNGAKVGEVHQGPAVFDVVVVGHPDVRRSWPELRRLEIDLPGGRGTVPLGAVADLRLVNAPNAIRHEQASRCIDVTCNVAAGADLGRVVREISERLEPLQQEGYRTEVLGEYQARTENQWQLFGTVLLSGLGIVLLLYLDFRSLRLTLLVLLTLPFALLGGVAAAWLGGGVLSLGSLVGFITVLGIAARNGIMLVSHYRHLQADERVPFGRELILRGAEERVAPILMTALAAGLGLLPLAISGNKPGYEVEYPMAVVILGGLATSTLLNLLVLPVLFERFGRVPLPADEYYPPAAAGKTD